ncbi:MAG: hypothetical protein K2L12_00060 [Clostridia bacterium]|nr:hypothetical protein [Clostridia bacterium]
MKLMTKKALKRNYKKLAAVGLACIMTTAAFIPNIGLLSAHATISTPEEINDLGYLGRGVNLLRDIDTNDKSDDLLSQNHLKLVLDDADLSDFTVSKDYISTSYGQGFTSKSFVSLAMSMGVDLSTKANASSNFVIGSAKMEAGFSMGVNVSASTSVDVEYTIYNYQKYLDAWTLNWDNGGVMGSASTLRNHLRGNVYGALTDSFPQYTWSPKDFFDTYGTHIIVSYKRGGEYTFSSIYMDLKASVSTEISSSAEVKGKTSVSKFGSAGFETKVTEKETMSLDTENEFRVTSTFSRGSSKGQLDETKVDSVNTWGDGVDNENAQVLSSGLTLISMWDLLPSQYADRKAELKNYYNEQVAGKSNDLLNKFVYKTVNEGDFDFSQYDAVISSASQLDEIRNNMQGRYILACDIDLGEISNWRPIGTELNKFTGIFDGNNNAINNLNITNWDEPYVGLFGYSTGTIKNLSVNGTISLDNSPTLGVGGIVGWNGGVIKNCQNNVTINSTVEFVGKNSDDELLIDKPTVDTQSLFEEAKHITATEVTQVPEYIDETTVLDLRAFNGEVNKTITLRTGAEALRIIGDSQKEYVGLNIKIENSPFERYVALENVNIVYSSDKGAISSNAENVVWIISEGNSNSIKTDKIGIASALNVAGGLNIVGSAKLTISGSQGKAGGEGAYNGTNGSGAGASGKSGNTGDPGHIGGVSIIADEVKINIESELTIIGGKGGTGGIGGVGANGLKGSNAGFIWVGGGDGGNGGNGGNGGVGGVGGQAMNINRLTVFGGNVNIKGGAGGDGGNGGVGGNGGAGGNGIWASNGKTGVGGAGGIGGNGGLFGNAIDLESTVIKVYENTQLVLNDNGVGSGGNGGNGGSGRDSRKDGNRGGSTAVPNNKQRVIYYTSTAKYSLYDTSLTYGEVDTLSSTLGMQENLFSIHSQQDQTIVEKLFKNYNAPENKMYWIGAKRVATNLNKWKWQDGSTIEYDYREKKYLLSGGTSAYTNWAEGQPSSIEDEDYVAINSSSGLWYSNYNNVKGGFITKELLENGAGLGNYDIYVGGVIGYNKGNVSQCINESDIQLTIKSKEDFGGAVSGVVGLNSGEVTQVVNKGKINIKLISIDNPTLNANIVVKKITEDTASGVSLEYKNIGSKGNFVSEDYYGSAPKWEWVNDEDTEGKSEEYNVEWENVFESLWAKDRIHVASIEDTEFLQGEVLSNKIIELSYYNSEKKEDVVTTAYSYKYCFETEGVTAIKLSFKYQNKEDVRYVPVKVVAVKIANVEIDYDETKLNYQYGDDFVCPIIKITMSDGMTESIMVKEDDVYNVPAMTNYGEHEITIKYRDSKNNYERELNYTINIAQKVVESTAAQLKIQNRTSVADGEVIVQFSFANMPELKSVLLYSFIYDDTRLEIIEGRWKVDGVIADWDAKEEIATFTYADNQESNVYIFELVIKVKEDCPAGDYTISCAALVNAVDEQGFDTPVSLEVAPGNVSVIDVPRGDFNNDKKVDENDAIHLLRYTLFGDSAFSLNQSGDVNGDDIVNSDDAIFLLRYTLLPEEYPLYW